MPKKLDKKTVYTFSGKSQQLNKSPIHSDAEAKTELLKLIADVERYIKELMKICDGFLSIKQKQSTAREFEKSKSSIKEANQLFKQAKEDLVKFKKEVTGKGISKDDAEAQLERLKEIFIQISKADSTMQVEVPVLEYNGGWTEHNGRLRTPAQRMIAIRETRTHNFIKTNEFTSLHQKIIDNFILFVDRVKDFFGFSSGYYYQLRQQLAALHEPDVSEMVFKPTQKT